MVIEEIDRVIYGEESSMQQAKRKIMQKESDEDMLQRILDDEEQKEIGKIVNSYFNMMDLAEQILKIQPLYFDEARIWWAWVQNENCWKIIDDTSILNFVGKLSTANTIKTKEKHEILEALKQSSRMKKPHSIKPTWIQFKDTFYDIRTGEEFPVSPFYFATNPIPYALHEEKSRETPMMDKIFGEWVGKEHVQILYEIIAYCLIPDYPIHRLFCLIGEGLNGKSCFLRLLKKFIGEGNVTATELDTLLTSRFEVTRLHKKLVCIMGETNFSEISKTSILKKLTGGDVIGFEYKNKNPFEDLNYAKILIATNNLPTTTDKTIGFYRRWCIIDFPNKFSEKKDILKDIPEEEYSALAVKTAHILKDLLETREFTNEGTIEERQEKYEAKSNFLGKFIKLFTMEDVDGYITKAEFYRKFNSWCKENRHRQLAETSVNKEMKKLGIEDGRKWLEYKDDKGNPIQARVWFSIKWREDF